jgi:hypothetical protein
MSCNTYDAGPTKASTKALTTDQLRAKLYEYDKTIGVENDPALRYDVTKLSNALGLTVANFTNVTDYPNLQERIKQAPITKSEYADFLNSTGYNLDQVIAIFSGLPVAAFTIPEYYNQLDNYYNKNFANSLSGGFCSMFNGALAKLMALASAGAALISQLKNGIAAVIGQLMAIKNILFNLVDKVKEMMLQRIQQLVGQITQLKTQVVSAMRYLSEKANKVKEFFSDLNMQNLKTKLEGLIAKMAGSFEELTPDVIAYLLFRLCQIVETVQNFLQSPVDTFKNLLSNFAIQEMKLTNLSNIGRLGSVQAGGYRMDPFEIARVKEQMANDINGNATPGVYPKGYVTRPFTEEDWNLYNQLTTAGNQYVEFGSQVINQNDPIVNAGVKMIKPEVLMILFRVAKRMGVKFLINSGYRSPEYNAKQRGAVKNSMHTSGMALDVDMTRHGNSTEFRNKFIEFASQEGIGGIGAYNSFIHIDIGNRRIWGPNTSRSSIGQTGNADALVLHEQDKFRNGSGTTEVPQSEPTSAPSTTSAVDPGIAEAIRRQSAVAPGGATTITTNGVIDTGGIIPEVSSPFGA